MSELTESNLAAPVGVSARVPDAETVLLHERNMEALVSDYRGSGEWPSPALLSEIIARGEEAVAPLISFVREADVADPLAYYGVELLIILGDSIALPEIARFYHDSDTDYAESFEMSLPAMGPVVVPYLMPFVSDRSLDWYQRASAIEIMQYVIGDDENLRRELIDAVTSELAVYLADAGSISTLPDDERYNYYEAVSWFISDLADLGAAESLPLIQRAFDADLVDYMIVGEEVLTEPLTYKVRKYRGYDWMEWYANEYEHRNDPPPTRPELARLRDSYRDPGPSKPYIAPPKPGRNDACWCGSGKKYKKCHLGKPDDKYVGA